MSDVALQSTCEYAVQLETAPQRSDVTYTHLRRYTGGIIATIMFASPSAAVFKARNRGSIGVRSLVCCGRQFALFGGVMLSVQTFFSSCFRTVRFGAEEEHVLSATNALLVVVVHFRCSTAVQIILA